MDKHSPQDTNAQLAQSLRQAVEALDELVSSNTAEPQSIEHTRSALERSLAQSAEAGLDHAAQAVRAMLDTVAGVERQPWLAPAVVSNIRAGRDGLEACVASLSSEELADALAPSSPQPTSHTSAAQHAPTTQNAEHANDTAPALSPFRRTDQQQNEAEDLQAAQPPETGDPSHTTQLSGETPPVSPFRRTDTNQQPAAADEPHSQTSEAPDHSQLEPLADRTDAQPHALNDAPTAATPADDETAPAADDQRPPARFHATNLHAAAPALPQPLDASDHHNADAHSPSDLQTAKANASETDEAAPIGVTEDANENEAEAEAAELTDSTPFHAHAPTTETEAQTETQTETQTEAAEAPQGNDPQPPQHEAEATPADGPHEQPDALHTDTAEHHAHASNDPLAALRQTVDELERATSDAAGHEPPYAADPSDNAQESTPEPTDQPADLPTNQLNNPFTDQAADQSNQPTGHPGVEASPPVADDTGPAEALRESSAAPANNAETTAPEALENDTLEAEAAEHEPTEQGAAEQEAAEQEPAEQEAAEQEAAEHEAAEQEPAEQEPAEAEPAPALQAEPAPEPPADPAAQFESECASILNDLAPDADAAAAGTTPEDIAHDPVQAATQTPADKTDPAPASDAQPAQLPGQDQSEEHPDPDADPERNEAAALTEDPVLNEAEQLNTDPDPTEDAQASAEREAEPDAFQTADPNTPLDPTGGAFQPADPNTPLDPTGGAFQPADPNTPLDPTGDAFQPADPNTPLDPTGGDGIAELSPEMMAALLEAESVEWGSFPIDLPAERAEILLYMVADLRNSVDELGSTMAEAVDFSSRTEAASRLATLCEEMARVTEFFEFPSLKELIAILRLVGAGLPTVEEATASELLLRVSAIKSLIEQFCSGAEVGMEMRWPLETLRRRIEMLLANKRLHPELCAWHRNEIERVLELDGIVEGVETLPVPDSEEAPAGSATGAMAQTSDPSQATIRVSRDAVEDLLDISRQLVLNKNRLASLAHEMRLGDNDNAGSETLESHTEDLSRLVARLQARLTNTRVQSIGKLFDRYQRIVRDVAGLNNKSVSFDTRGAETQIDKFILDDLAEPLAQILRFVGNTLLETAEQRAEAGKPETGKIRLSAQDMGSHTVIIIDDDGCGLDEDTVRADAAACERVPAGLNLHKMHGPELFALLLHDWFENSPLCGVGRRLADIRATVEIRSEPGNTRFVLHIPVKSAVVGAMLVSLGNETFAVPLSNIVEIIRLDDNTDSIHGRPVVRVRDRVVPVLESRRLLGMNDDEKPDLAVVVQSGEEDCALSVDRILGHQEIVIEPLDVGDANNRGPFEGVTIHNDGTACLVLDIAKLAAMQHGLLTRANAEPAVV